MKYTYFLFALVGFVCANPVEIQDVPESPVFGYITKYGIPEGERILKEEQEYLNHGSRIVGGVPAGLGQYPYMVGVISDIVGISGRGVCGGSLVTTQRVVTAAHCWNDGRNQAWKFELVFGSVLLFSGGTRIDSSAVVMHPSWSPSLVRNDVAVVYLPNAVATSAFISPIALPSGAELNNNFAGSAAIAVGFGITRDGEGISNTQFLNHVRLSVITNSVCSVGFPLLIQSSNICTSGLVGGTCGGDSGGPLVLNSGGRDILIGITSFGSSMGCQAALPSVYARTTSYNSFISQHM